jgi:RNA polymerase sigma-70 factor (ECF subfamily)
VDSDRARFEAIFEQHYAALMRYAVRRVGPDAAAEVVSETFLVAWRRLDTVPLQSLPWLYATARRVVANELRRRRRSGQLEQRLAHDDPAVVSGDHAEVIGDRLRLRAALAGLPERDREVLYLTHWEHLGPDDVARTLGCSPAAAKVRLHRARRRLAGLLGPASGTPITELINHGGTP